MNNEVKTILESVTVEGQPLKCALLHFDGEADTFALYSPSGERVGLAGDDTVLEEIERWDIDVYSKSNYLVTCKAIKQAFRNAGWVFLGSGVDTYDEPTKMYHRLLEFEKEVGA